MNVTIALAVMSMFVIEWSGIHKNGLVHWCKHFCKASADRSTNHDTGDRDPSAVALYATVW